MVTLLLTALGIVLALVGLLLIAMSAAALHSALSDAGGKLDAILSVVMLLTGSLLVSAGLVSVEGAW